MHLPYFECKVNSLESAIWAALPKGPPLALILDTTHIIETAARREGVALVRPRVPLTPELNPLDRDLLIFLTRGVGH